MPAYRFSWEAFDDDTVLALARNEGFEGAIAGARAWLGQSVKRPNDDFVRRNKDVIARVWLPKYPGAVDMVSLLQYYDIGPGGGTLRSTESAARYVDRCRNSANLRRLITNVMINFGDVDRKGTDGDGGSGLDVVPRFALLAPDKQSEDPRRPHAYQNDAWSRLSGELARAEATGKFEGLLVMPTGSGKTYTAVRWLMDSVVNRSGRVLWLAHRHELLNQAAKEFHALAGLARSREKIRVRLVSQVHCRAHQIDPADDVVLSTVSALARAPEIAEWLLGDNRLFLVVDEAHHAPAKTYRQILKTLSSKKRGVLGLTATPTRTIESERPVLANLFGGKILFEKGLRELIEQRFLAQPIPIRVDTGANVEVGLTDKDKEHLSQFQDLSEEWLDRIANLSQRNATIIRHLVEHKAKYGKTVVFAINVHHAALLVEQLRDAGIRAEYVASYRPDGSQVDERQVLATYRDRNSGLDVLVNVQMLTEGFDAPGTQTVFLTRPTRSEIQLRQMVGRALRGPAVGGNEKAYLVSFEDHWERFPEWQAKFDLVPDITQATMPEPAVEPEVKAPEQEELERLVQVLPWDAIRAVAAATRQHGIEHQADAFEAVPHGWYLLEREVEGDPVRVVIPVHEHQRASWKAYIDRLGSLDVQALAAVDHSLEHLEHFDDCFPVVPSELDSLSVLEHFRGGGDAPEYFEIQSRRASDPYALADEIASSDLRESEKVALIEQRYSKLAQAIYPTLRDFRSAIEDALYERRHPREATRRPVGTPIFEPRPDHTIRSGEHDLAALFAETLQRGPDLLGTPLVHVGPVRWTRRPIKGFWAYARYKDDEPHGHGEIRVNKLLNSEDVSPDTLRFLLWHEYLHLHLKSRRHDAHFRELERLWPNWLDHDRALDNLPEEHGLRYW